MWVTIWPVWNERNYQSRSYTSFFKREPQYDSFTAKEIINPRILLQQTSQTCIPRSLNTERSYISRQRCSACQSQIPTEGQCSHFIRKIASATTSKPDMHVYLVLQVWAQAAQALFMNHTRNTIWRRIIRVCVEFSTRYPWRSLKVKIFNENGLPYTLRVLFTPGVVILPI